MKVLVFGDVYGKKGRQLLSQHLPELKEKYSPDFIVMNSENISHGKGPIPKHLRELESLGIDIFTGGNHSFAHLSQIRDILENPNESLLRPANYYSSERFHIPGQGFRIFEKNGLRLGVLNLISSVFMRDSVNNPFLCADTLLDGQHECDGIIVDFHRETTAELACMAHFLSGRVAAVYGTHTHIQTNDERILPSGTALMTDIGMTGPLDGSVGQDFESRTLQFLSGVSFLGEKSVIAEGKGVVCALFLDISKNTTIYLEKIRISE